MTFTNYSVYVFWLFRLGVGAAVNESHCFLYSLCQSTDGIHSQVWLNSKHIRARTHSYTHASVPACPHTLTVHPQHSSLKDSHCRSNPPTPPWCTCKVNMYKRQTGKVIGGVFLRSASAWQQSRLFVASVGLDFPAPMELVVSVCAPLCKLVNSPLMVQKKKTAHSFLILWIKSWKQHFGPSDLHQAHTKHHSISHVWTKRMW